MRRANYYYFLVQQAVLRAYVPQPPEESDIPLANLNCSQPVSMLREQGKGGKSGARKTNIVIISRRPLTSTGSSRYVNPSERVDARLGEHACHPPSKGSAAILKEWSTGIQAISATVLEHFFPLGISRPRKDQIDPYSAKASSTNQPGTGSHFTLLPLTGISYSFLLLHALFCAKGPHGHGGGSSPRSYERTRRHCGAIETRCQKIATGRCNWCPAAA
jgi:hypothetical protein